MVAGARMTMWENCGHDNGQGHSRHSLSHGVIPDIGYRESILLFFVLNDLFHE
jgi:hypothetical protein